MKEICIPVPGFGDDQIADVSITVGNKKMSFSFRVESFPWRIDNQNENSEGLDSDIEHATLEQINNLRKTLSSYDKGWELIQIFTPRRGASHIQVLYRKINN